MRDNPRKNLKWLEQELLAQEEVFHDFREPAYEEDEDLLELVDMLLEEEEDTSEYEEEEPPIRNFANNYGHSTRGQRAVRAHSQKQFDPNAAVAVKSRKQLRREEKLRRKEEKKASVNRNIKDLVVLAALECIGILAIIGWWLQWLI